MIVREAREGDAKAARRVVTAAFGRSNEAAIIDGVKTSGEVLVELVAEIASPAAFGWASP